MTISEPSRQSGPPRECVPTRVRGVLQLEVNLLMADIKACRSLDDLAALDCAARALYESSKDIAYMPSREAMKNEIKRVRAWAARRLGELLTASGHTLNLGRVWVGRYKREVAIRLAAMPIETFLSEVSKSPPTPLADMAISVGRRDE